MSTVYSRVYGQGRAPLKFTIGQLILRQYSVCFLMSFFSQVTPLIMIDCQ